MLNIFLAIHLKLDYNNIYPDGLIHIEREIKIDMRLKLFDKRYNRNKDFLYWHVDICTDEHFVEDKLHDFHCQKKNLIASKSSVYATSPWMWPLPKTTPTKALKQN